MSAISNPEHSHDAAHPDLPVVYHDAEVVDEHGEHIGSITDVIYDDLSDSPQWLTVHLGLLSSLHYVPVANSYKAENGGIVVPYDKTFVKHAPKANKDHVLTSAMKAELNTYYGIS